MPQSNTDPARRRLETSRESGRMPCAHGGGRICERVREKCKSPRAQVRGLGFFLLPLPFRGERAGVRGERFARSKPTFAQDCIQHCVRVIEHIGVAEAHDTITVRLQPPGSLDVATDAHVVRRPVKFDDQLQLRAEEIGEVWADGNLSAELQTIELPVSKALPEDSLSRDVLMAQLTGALEAIRAHAMSAIGRLLTFRVSPLTPALSPRKGRGSRPHLSSIVTPFITSPCSILSTTSCPSLTCPNTVCLPSSRWTGPCVMKNWLPLLFVPGPRLAIESTPALSCLLGFLTGSTSSSNV